MALSKEEILEALKQIYDPEIPVDIVNLGLILDVSADGGRIAIKMRTTAPSCPAGNYLAAEVEKVILQLSEVEKLVGRVAATPDISVEIVDDPPWSPDAMTEEGKRTMGRS